MAIEKVIWCGMKRPSKEQRKALNLIGEITFLRTVDLDLLKRFMTHDVKVLKEAATQLIDTYGTEYVICGLAGSYLFQYIFGLTMFKMDNRLSANVFFSIKKEGEAKYDKHGAYVGNASCVHDYFVNILGEKL